MVSAQVALAIILLIGSGLLIQSFLKAIDVDPGINTRKVYAFKYSLADIVWGKTGRAPQFKEQLLASLREIPGIESVALTSSIPFLDPLKTLDGTPWPPPPPGSGIDPDFEMVPSRITYVSQDYFELLGIRLLKGRFFNSSDYPKGVIMPMIIDKDYAEQFFKGQDPIGKYYSPLYTPDDPRFDPERAVPIVGVVENIKHEGLDNRSLAINKKELPLVYGFIQQWDPRKNAGLLIKTKRSFNEILPLVRKKVREIDPKIPLYVNSSLEDLVKGTLNDRRAFMLLVTILSSMALLLSAIGIYGVIAYDVTQRTREIGLRMAMGATRKNTLQLIIQQGLFKVVVGMAVGIIGAYVLSDRISAYLFEVTPTEPSTFIGITIFVLVIAFLASYMPARRASRIQPMDALRVE